MAVAAIMVVVGAVVCSSLRILASPQHSWEGLRAVNFSPQFFGALPLIIFSFSVGTPRPRPAAAADTAVGGRVLLGKGAAAPAAACRVSGPSRAACWPCRLSVRCPGLQPG
jgi:hypothetical protein